MSSENGLPPNNNPNNPENNTNDPQQRQNSPPPEPRSSAATTQEIKDEIIRNLDIRAFYERYLSERLPNAAASGWTERVKCPIHKDTKTPNFFVNMQTGGFSCKACNQKGSAFDFWILMQGGNVDDRTQFADAIVALANEASIDIGKFKGPGGTRRTPAAKKPVITEDETFIPKQNKADSNDAANLPIATEVVDRLHGALTPELYEYFFKKRGLIKDTVDAFRLGWDDTWKGMDKDDGKWFGGRITIPIPDKIGLIRNLRGYSSRCTPEYKMGNYVVDKKKESEIRYGSPARLFGLDRMLHFQWKHVVIVEGEFDMMLLNQLFALAGLGTWGAVTGTHGANTFEAEWVQYFFGRNVYLCLDCDKPGKEAMHNIANKFFLRPMQVGKFESVKMVDLPLEGTKESKDIGNYFLDVQMSINDFLQLLHTTPELIAGGLDSDESTIAPIIVPDLVSALKDRTYIDQRISVPLTISGSTSKIYHAIREYTVTKCPLMEKSECCCQTAGTLSIPYGHTQFIASCMQSEAANLKAIAGMICQKEQPCRVTSVRKVIMEQHVAHQVVERRSAEEMDGQLNSADELTEAMIYVLQPEENQRVETQDYTAVGFVRTHPKTSIATLFVESLVPIEEDWKKFTVENPATQATLRALQAMPMDDILSDITKGVTFIYNADHILYTTLLTFLSPIRFVFNGNIQRGWLNTAIVGDSGTGKSKTYERLSDWMGVGEVFSGQTGTRTGLLYSIKQRNNEWYVSPGRYPRSSGTALAIDEAQEVAKEELKAMAGAMAEGYMKVEQVASGGYNTMVRTIFLMNPKKKGVYDAATISDFVYGCDALRNCFDPMFIRRLDCAIFVTGVEDHAFYNQKSSGSVETIKLSAGMLKALVHWAWTRRINQIRWSDEATNYCLSKATEMSTIYGYCPDIPLVNPQDFREKLARLSTAYAILDRNFTEDLQSVNVEPRHVEAMVNFFNMIYSAQECNLLAKSSQAKSRNTLMDYEKIREVFAKTIDGARNSANAVYRSGHHFCQMLLFIETLDFVQKRVLSEQLGVEPRWVHSKLAVLQAWNLIEMGKYGYTKTKKFNLFMQRWRMDDDVSDMLNNVYALLGSTAMQEGDDGMGVIRSSTYVSQDFETQSTYEGHVANQIDAANAAMQEASYGGATKSGGNGKAATPKQVNKPKPAAPDPF